MMKNLSLFILPIFFGCATAPVSNAPEKVDAAIRTHRDEIRYCYERALNSDKKPGSGKVVLNWVIQQNGKIKDLKVVESTLNNSDVEKCIMVVLTKVQFPEVKEPATITYPFGFKQY